MKIVVNGKPVETSTGSLEELLVELGFGTTVVATAVNGDFAPAPKRPTISLKEGDQVEILAPMQGG
jgi:sulfur carrier protein